MKNDFRFSSLFIVFILFLTYISQSIFLFLTEEFILDSSLAAERPWTLLTSIFLHGSVIHILSNAFALAIFGLLTEKNIGTKKFLFVFFAGGIFANLISLMFYSKSLGASGAIFSCIGVLAFIKPRLMVWAYGVPMPMAVAAAFWFVLDFFGAFYPSNIANIAHIAGLLFGIFIGIFLKKKYKERVEKRKKILREEEFELWEKQWMKKTSSSL